MTKQFRYSTCLFLMILFITSINIHKGYAQTADVKIKGIVLESGSGLPLKQVLVSVSSTGKSAETDDKGMFTIDVPDKKSEIIIELPGYTKRNIFILGRDSLVISLVSNEYKSGDNLYNNPLGTATIKDATYSIASLNSNDMDYSKSTSFDPKMQGKVAGLRITEQSGMPGSKTWMNLRGVSSLYGKNQPLLFIDGMIHDYDFTNLSLMEGFSLNPMDIIDVEDISDVTVLKNGDAYLGGISSNGVVNINTEQKSEASTVIKVTGYYGMTMVPENQDVMNANEYRSYLKDVNAPFSWVNGSVPPKYDNSTDWQKEIFTAGSIQKAHMFLKGGDDIATYNISTGYVKQNTIYEKANFSRFNLRINGKVNITDRFSVAPNAKLSLADSYLPSQGYSAYKNPLLSSLAIAPVMGVYARDVKTGVQLPFLDDEGVLKVSNPVAVAKNAVGTNRNYNFLSSVNAVYKISPKLQISNLVGIDFNNSRESLFLPNLGLAQVDSAYNSPQDLTAEYRSTQNHTTISYSNKLASGHSFDVNAGLKYMENTYKIVNLYDLNTPGDEFKNLGAGTGYLTYMRSTTGDDRGILWLSYFGNVSYNYLNTYFLNANISYDGSSSVGGDNRYNLYPSIGAAWRVSSLMGQSTWLEDLKLRASWSQTGNIFSNVYDNSKLYYLDTRYTDLGVLTREAITNKDLEIEKKTTLNIGVDVSMFRQTTNIHFDYFKSNVDNLIIAQKLSDAFGYTNYYNNGGKLENNGIEIAADQRLQLGDLVFKLNATLAKNTNEVTGLTFINSSQKNIVTDAASAQYITSVGNVVNAFYGYKTNGVFSSASEANGIIGPKGLPMQAGDIRYVDADGNNVIDENDKTIIGNPNPDLFGGFSAMLSFKGIELFADFTYSMGNDAFNYVRYKSESMDSYNNQLRTVSERWTSSNTGATMPRFSYGDPTGNTLFSDRWIEDGSYVRLKQLTLSYTFSGKRLYKAITIYGTATNLLTFTSYSGYDPEFMYMNSPFVMGIDYGAIPQTRSFMLGLKLDL